MTLAEFLASMEAQYGRSGTTEDVLNIPMSAADQYLALAAQQYGNIGSIQDWSQRYADPGGNGGVSPQQMWAMQNGVRLTPTLGGPSADANGTLPPQITGNTGVMGRFRDPETGLYYSLQGQYDAGGNLQDGAGIYEYRPHAGNNFFSAIGPAVRTIGGAMLGAYGASQLAGAAGAGAGGAGAGGAGLAEGTIMPDALTGAGGAGAGASASSSLAARMAAQEAARQLAAGGGTLGSWLSNPAVIGAGANLVGGAMGASAARDAAATQAASANAAIEEVRRQYDQNRADQMPWLQAGQQTLGDLMAQLPDLNRAYTQADFQNDPGYQFEMAEGQRALDAAARARGLYGSSGALRELLRYSQGLASTRYQDAWNRDLTQRQNTFNQLSGIAGTGQTAAANLGAMGTNRANTVGDLLTQSGNAQAAGRVGAANAWTQAGSNALNAWQQQMLIDRIGSNLYR